MFYKISHILGIYKQHPGGAIRGGVVTSLRRCVTVAVPGAVGHCSKDNGDLMFVHHSKVPEIVKLHYAETCLAGKHAAV